MYRQYMFVSTTPQNPKTCHVHPSTTTLIILLETSMTKINRQLKVDKKNTEKPIKQMVK